MAFPLLAWEGRCAPTAPIVTHPTLNKDLPRTSEEIAKLLRIWRNFFAVAASWSLAHRLRVRILLTNDDGVNARGLKLLEKVARDLRVSIPIWVRNSNRTMSRTKSKFLVEIRVDQSLKGQIRATNQ